jgi:hypothetical protein
MDRGQRVIEQFIFDNVVGDIGLVTAASALSY